jgi:O-antigen ligase
VSTDNITEKKLENIPSSRNETGKIWKFISYFIAIISCAAIGYLSGWKTAEVIMLAVVLMGGLLYFFKMDLAIALIFFAVVFEFSFPAGPIFMTTGEILVLGLIGVFAIRLPNGLTFIRTRIDHWLVLFIIWNAVSMYGSYDSSLTFKALLSRLGFMAFFFIVVQVIRTEAQVRRVIKFLIISGLIMAVGGIYDRLTGVNLVFKFGIVPYSRDWDYYGLFFFNNKNGLGGYLDQILPMFIGLALAARSYSRRLWYWAVSVTVIAGIIFSLSRGSWLALLAVSGLFIIIISSKKPLLKIVTVLMVFLLMLSGTILLRNTPDFIKLRFEATSNVKHEATVRRLFYMQSALEMIKHHPINGVGLGAFRTAYEKDYKIRKGPEPSAETCAHNMSLQMAAESGLLILVIFYAAMLKLLIPAWRAWRRIHDPAKSWLFLGIWLSVCAALMHGLVDHLWFPSPSLEWLFWGQVALLISLQKYYEKTGDIEYD